MSVWERVPWCSKSFSPRRGRVGWSVVLQRCELDVGKSGRLREVYWESVDRKRKSWVSSERSVSVGSGVALMVESSSISAMVVEESTKLALRDGLFQENGLPRPTSFYNFEIRRTAENACNLRRRFLLFATLETGGWLSVYCSCSGPQLTCP